MQAPITIRPLAAKDIHPISAAFAAIGWSKPPSQYERYLDEQARGLRPVWLALLGESFAGYLTLHWEPRYPTFRALGLPEIQDLNVLPRFRRRGIATRLLDEAERCAAARAPAVGIGVGLYADYGAAQRLYVLRGYVPDGQGVFYDNQPVAPGARVAVDDALILYLVKRFAPAT